MSIFLFFSSPFFFSFSFLLKLGGEMEARGRGGGEKRERKNGVRNEAVGKGREGELGVYEPKGRVFY